MFAMSGGALAAKHYLVKLGFCFSSSVVQAAVWEACDLTIPHRLRDTHRAMPEESTTPDLVERVHQSVRAGSERDIDRTLTFYTPDAVWDMSPWGTPHYPSHDRQPLAAQPTEQPGARHDLRHAGIPGVSR
jgi:hypothetical protein